MRTPFLYHFWVGISRVLAPILARKETAKLRAAGVSLERAREKQGYATHERQSNGPVIWFHAASVGESLSVLALITRMGAALPDAQFVITSGTASSAALLAKRMPPRAIHQFAPLDAPGPLTRFLDHWHPDAAVFVESELWPQMLRRTRDRGVRMVLVNARLSERSLARWLKMPRLARYMLECFDLIVTQNQTMGDAMIAIGAPPDRVLRGSNLKSMAGPLPVDMAQLAQTKTALGDRPRWVASSTHEGEEAVVLQAHQTLQDRWPVLCLILAPRHTERATEVTKLVADAGLSMSRRTQGDAPDKQVFLADTMGELGTWYSLSDIVFLGGGLAPKGGHNPYEVAHMGAGVITGPHVFNFAETYDQMTEAGAAFVVQDAATLAAQVGALLADAELRAATCTAARSFAAAQSDQLDEITRHLISVLELG